MDAKQIQSFCATASELLTQIGTYASAEIAQRKPADDALVRQLRIVVSALAVALENIARLTRPAMPPMPAPLVAPSPA